MNLSAHYDKLYYESTAKIAKGDYEIDHLIDAQDDYRFGITLMIRPDENTRANIQHFLSEAKAVDPHQYYYQNTDLHLTVMSIISCYVGFDLEQINVADYIKVLEAILAKHRNSKFNLKDLLPPLPAFCCRDFQLIR